MLTINFQQKSPKVVYYISAKVDFNPEYLQDHYFTIAADRQTADIVLNIAKTFVYDPWAGITITYQNLKTKLSRVLFQYDINVCAILGKQGTQLNSFVSGWINNFWKYGDLPRSCPIKKQQKGPRLVYFVKSDLTFNPRYLQDHFIIIAPDRLTVNITLNFAVDFINDPWAEIMLGVKNRKDNNYRNLFKYDINVCTVLGKSGVNQLNKFALGWINNVWKYGNLPKSCPLKKKTRTLYFQAVKFDKNEQFLNNFDITINSDNTSINILMELREDVDNIWGNAILHIWLNKLKEYKQVISYDVNVCLQLQRSKWEKNNIISIWIQNFLKFGNLSKSCPILKNLYMFPNLKADKESIPTFTPAGRCRLETSIYTTQKGFKQTLGNAQFDIELK
ncbi:hypothetical protein FF38_13699 [Lucilia cuprina]|uniref:Uncharacterized protein n=1 Tax=Lucilia cuprina TaxID=7375 RepID=A0A0L0BW51_LUCCU|nr:hypothetical protein FF38_13699 [Lucilia cuprina]